MFGHQDYLGEMEIIIADGKCQTSHTCTTDKQEVSNPLKVAMAKDKRIRYYDDVNVGHLGEKRNWLLDKATGDVILHFDDDDYYAPHYVRFMVDALFYSKADVIRLLSWVTYGEGFTLEPWTRYPIMEWEEQHGFGWAYSYAYTKKYGLANKFSGDKDASEEKNFVSPFQFTGTTPDVLAYGPDVLMDVRVANGPSDNMILYDHPKKDATDKPKRAKYSWMSIPDIYLSCVGRPALLSIGLLPRTVCAACLTAAHAARLAQDAAYRFLELHAHDWQYPDQGLQHERRRPQVQAAQRWLPEHRVPCAHAL